MMSQPQAMGKGSGMMPAMTSGMMPDMTGADTTYMRSSSEEDDDGGDIRLKDVVGKIVKAVGGGLQAKEATQHRKMRSSNKMDEDNGSGKSKKTGLAGAMDWSKLAPETAGQINSGKTDWSEVAEKILPLVGMNPLALEGGGRRNGGKTVGEMVWASLGKPP